MKRTFATLSTLIAVAMTGQVLAHCQIPCGIYGDQTRATLLAEHITTIEKSMKQIVELSAKTPTDYNQLVRWVNNKEEHADKISEIVTYYFMAQRVKKPADGDPAKQKAYIEQLTILHEMLVSTMKAKQSTDLVHIENLRSQLDRFSHAYPGLEHSH